MGETPYGATGAWQAQQVTVDPAAQRAWRRGVVAGLLQLPSPLVFALALVIGLAFEVPTAATDPHGYLLIVSFIASLALALFMVALAGVGLALVRNGKRAGAAVIAVCSVVAALESIALVAGFPGGFGALVPARLAMLALGVIWLAVSLWCLVASIRVLRVGTI